MRGQLAGGYCQTELIDGSFKTTVMPPEEILAIEEQGKAMGNEAWLSVHVDQMREKTLIKRHWKTLCPCIYRDSVMNDPMLFDDQDCQHSSNQQAYEEQFESAYSREAY